MPAGPARRRIAGAIIAAVAMATSLTVMLSGCTPDAHVELDVPAQVDGAFDEATALQLQDAVTHAMTAAGASGAIVGVWAPWSGSWVAGVGTESMTDPTPVSADMQFRATRVTRAMTCDVLYVLAENGTVALNDSVTEYVSGVPDLADITLSQLCDSTSGVGTYADKLYNLWLQNPSRVWNPREMASYGLGQMSDIEPGSAYRDSDAGYLLLGLALERATGSSAEALLEEYVFDPLDLTSTSLPSGAASASSSASSSSSSAPVLNGHHSMPDGAGVMNCTDPLDITSLSASAGFTDSGVVTTIEDLGRYAQALAAGALMPEGSDRFENPIALAPDSPSWYLTKGGAILPGSLIGQYGSVPGYATAAFSDQTTGLTVAVVLNNSGGGALFAEQLSLELAAIASKAPAAQGQTAPEGGLPWTAQQYRDIIASHPICAAPAQ